jgi:hypothetical protein
MEIFWKFLFWVGVLGLFIFYGIATDPTVRADRRKREQEKLAMDFHSRLEKGAPRDE